MQYHFDIAKTDFGKFFILDSRKGLHFILKNNDKRVPVLKSFYKPQKTLFNGRIHGVKIFNKALTEKEIVEIYNGQP